MGTVPHLTDLIFGQVLQLHLVEPEPRTMFGSVFVLQAQLERVEHLLRPQGAQHVRHPGLACHLHQQLSGRSAPLRQGERDDRGGRLPRHHHRTHVHQPRHCHRG